ncbi:hypothetical protein UY3_18382 [Chelonia mydas]|uniref:Uncharacterized protein n=1 Tax=Chelonia mydas TaxID=8469 RepID=M7B864_CHEMY|nr:hypothetical protein UY3_18382 [Chelonia mydas]
MLLTSVRDRASKGPPQKTGRAMRLDLVGRKVGSTGDLQLRILNQQAIVSRYSYTTCAVMAKFTELLPSDSRTEFSPLVEEEKLVSWASLQATLDAADAATRVMATGIAEDPRKQAAGPPMKVEVPAAPASSLSLPDEAITGSPHPVPQDDAIAHQELLKRVVSNLGLQAEELEEPFDSLFDVLCSTAPASVALPLHKGVSKITNALWQIPSSLAPISKRAERKYFVPTKGHEYLICHLAPNSLVIEVVNHKERQRQPGATPKK